MARLTDTIYELSEGQLKSPSQERFECDIKIHPKTSVCGSYHNLSLKGWSEITAKIYTNPNLSSFEIKGGRIQGKLEEL